MSWKRFFRREKWDEERARELASHLEIEADEDISRGVSCTEARHKALRKFGNTTAVREEIYRMNSLGFLEVLWQDVRFAVRQLRKSPGFTAIAITTLALGIGANSAMFSVVDVVLLRPLPYRTASRVVNLFERRPHENELKVPVAPGDFYEWRDKAKSFEQLAAVDDDTFNLTGTGEPQRVDGSDVSPGFFEVLGTQAIMGRTFRLDDEKKGADHVIVVSNGFWQRQLGSDANAVGRTLLLNDVPYSVVGVLPPDFKFPFAARSDIYLPISLTQKDREDHGAHYLTVVGLLRPGVTLNEAQAEMDLLSAQMEKEYPAVNTGHGVRMITLRTALAGDVQPALLVLLGAVGLVLLIACANVANLLLAQGKTRERELAVRAALGSGRSRLVRQLLTESMLLGLVGGAFAAAVAYWTLDALRTTFFTHPNNFALAGIGCAVIDGRVFAFTLFISLLTACLFGLAPALAASRVDLSGALKEGSRGSSIGDRRGFRSALIVAEVALSVVLLAGAGLLLRSFVNLMQVDPGFRPDHLYSANIDLPTKHYSTQRQTNAFSDQLLARVQSLPGVSSAALVDILPFHGDESRGAMHVEGRIPKPGEHSRLHAREVTPEYLRTMGIELIRGRDITNADVPGGKAVGVISATAARTYWPNQDPIGRRFTFNDEDKDWIEVVGIAVDVKHNNLAADATPDVYLPFAQKTENDPVDSFELAVRSTQAPNELESALRSQVRAIDADLPVGKMQWLVHLISDSIAPQRFNVALLTIFAALALALAAAGLYGVISFSVGQRTHEIGIRMALGAQPKDVLRMVIGQGLWLVLTGAAIGVAATLALTHVLARMLFGVGTSDPLTVFAVVTILGCISLAACYVPARRATRIDPIEALRYE
ncbi:MAG TPA: ABC transporter permease [Candidatus Acidoferrales bacterium]